MGTGPGSTPGDPPLREDAEGEISVLIATLHATGRRLEELTAGEVDSVVDSEGRTFLLQHAQDQLRHNDAAKQAGILNALPAHIALLDARGNIISVNEAWLRFASANTICGPGYGIGVNYLDTCDRARGDDSGEAHEVADGIRAVLDGSAETFSIEYPCHSPTEQRWFLMMVTPLSRESLSGAVVMHLDMTAERQTEESLRVSESRFRQMATSIRDVFFLQTLDSAQIYYVSPAYEEVWGRTCQSLYANPMSWMDSIHPDDLDRARAQSSAGWATGFDCEFRILRPDNETRWVHFRGFPILDDAGNPYRTAGVASDIIQRRRAEQQLHESERRFSDLLGNVQLLSVMLDREARITYCNAFLLKLTGWRIEEVIGRDWFEVFMPVELGDMKPRVFIGVIRSYV